MHQACMVPPALRSNRLFPSVPLSLAVVSFILLSLGSKCFAKTVVLEPSEPEKVYRAASPTGKHKLLAPTLSVPTLSVGLVGVLWNRTDFAQFKVVTVENDTNLIAAYDDSIFITGHGSTPEAAQARAKTKHHYITVWFKGFATKGIVDDDIVTIPCVVTVTGTKSYTTPSHKKKTVLLVEPRTETEKQRQERIKTADGAARRQQERTKAKEDREAATERTSWRTWTIDSSGTRIEAKFGGLISGKVKLIKRDGSSVRTPIGELSDEDRDWIKQRK